MTIIYQNEEYVSTGRAAKKHKSGKSYMLVEIIGINETDKSMTKWIDPTELFLVFEQSPPIIEELIQKGNENGTTRRRISKIS